MSGKGPCPNGSPRGARRGARRAICDVRGAMCDVRGAMCDANVCFRCRGTNGRRRFRRISTQTSAFDATTISLRRRLRRIATQSSAFDDDGTADADVCVAGLPSSRSTTDLTFRGIRSLRLVDIVRARCQGCIRAAHSAAPHPSGGGIHGPPGSRSALWLRRSCARSTRPQPFSEHSTTMIVKTCGRSVVEEARRVGRVPRVPCPVRPPGMPVVAETRTPRRHYRTVRRTRPS